MALRGTDPQSYITEYTLVYEEYRLDHTWSDVEVDAVASDAIEYVFASNRSNHDIYYAISTSNAKALVL